MVIVWFIWRRCLKKSAKITNIKISSWLIHCWSVSALAIAMEEQFNPLSSSPVFNNLMQILDVLSWCRFWMFYRDLAMIKCFQHSGMMKSRCWLNIMRCCCVKMDRTITRFEMNGTSWSQIFSQFQKHQRSKINYLQALKKIFTNEDIAATECKNVLQIDEILLITPFTNAKLERVFNRISRIHTESRNHLHSVHWCINLLKNNTPLFFAKSPLLTSANCQSSPF